MLISTVAQTNPRSTNDGSEGNKIFQICKAENAMAEGDVVQWSNTDSATYPVGFAVEDSVAGDGRVAGVVTDAGTGAAGDIAIVQCYGYCNNITTDGSVAASDKWLTAGSAVAVGATAANVNASITTAAYQTLKNVFAWNIKIDAGNVGEGFITVMGGGG